MAKSCLKILYAYDKVACFQINTEVFYVNLRYGYPELFDSQLKPVVVPNADYWFQHRTRQTVSYKNFIDLLAAYKAGAESKADLAKIGIHVAKSVSHKLVKTTFMRQLVTELWIESLSEREVIKLVSKIIDDFESFSKQYNESALAKVLSRLWFYCDKHALEVKEPFEKVIIRYLGERPQDPDYLLNGKAITELEQLIISDINNQLLNLNVPEHILENISKISGEEVKYSHRPLRDNHSPEERRAILDRLIKRRKEENKNKRDANRSD